MADFSHLGVGLTALFSFLLLVLVAELCYVLWWRRRFRQEIAGTDQLSADSYSSPSKELLYFFCWKTQCRVDPAGSSALFSDGNGQQSAADEFPQVYGEGDGPKWQGLGGPSRVLFTIKEEEREDSESDEGKSFTEVKIRTNSRSQTSVETVPDFENENAFFTPCSSPPFYTPLSSPSRTVENEAGFLHEAPEHSSGESDRFSFHISVADN